MQKRHSHLFDVASEHGGADRVDHGARFPDVGIERPSGLKFFDMCPGVCCRYRRKQDIALR
jgi:hypothetical protein